MYIFFRNGILVAPLGVKVQAIRLNATTIRVGRLVAQGIGGGIMNLIMQLTVSSYIPTPQPGETGLVVETGCSQLISIMHNGMPPDR